jgi:hypothetical protein
MHAAYMYIILSCFSCAEHSIFFILLQKSVESQQFQPLLLDAIVPEISKKDADDLFEFWTKVGGKWRCDLR